MRDLARLVAALALAALGQGASAAEGWQCATIGVGANPGLAQTTAGYLERAGRIYPSQLLGLVSAGGHLYLLNASDGGWSERVRQGLMELRLAEPDITAARRFHVTATGVVPVDPPAGDYACLAGGRAGRHGLALTGSGEMHLAPGKSVHLVDPREGSIRAEVRAVGREPLDFREILALSGRSSIYAGLAGGRTRPEAAAAPVAVAVGPAGRPDGEVIITPRVADAPARREDKAPVAAVVSSGVEGPRAPVVEAKQPPAAPPASTPTAAVEPAPGAQPAHAGQSYEDYAKAMKTLLALRRTSSVRSVSETTYVLPEVEYFRARRQ